MQKRTMALVALLACAPGLQAKSMKEKFKGIFQKAKKSFDYVTKQQLQKLKIATMKMWRQLQVSIENEVIKEFKKLDQKAQTEMDNAFELVDKEVRKLNIPGLNKRMNDIKQNVKKRLSDFVQKRSQEMEQKQK